MYIAGQPDRSRRPGTGNVEPTGSARQQRSDIRPMIVTAACTPTRGLRVVALLVFAVAGAGCATIIPRDVVPERLADEAQLAGMPNIRVWGDASAESFTVLSWTQKAKIGAFVEARRRSEQQSRKVNILAISGGGDNGAFGAGLLVGWGDAGTRPDFDLVTGVSAGALAAPFVYLGRSRDAEVFTIYKRSDTSTILASCRRYWDPAWSTALRSKT